MLRFIVIACGIVAPGAVGNIAHLVQSGGGPDAWPIGRDWYSTEIDQLHRQDTATYGAYLHLVPGGIRPAPGDRQLIESATAWAREVMNRTDMQKLLRGAGALRSRIRTMRAFSLAHVGGAHSGLPVFYPFSGFDLPTALSFFPTAPSFSMIAGLSTGDPACFVIAECRAHLADIATKVVIHWAQRGYAWTETHFMERAMHSWTCCENRTFVGSPPLRPGIIGLLVLCSVLMGHRLYELELRSGGHLRLVTDRTAIDYFSIAIAMDPVVQAAQLEHIRARVFGGQKVATLLKAAGAGGGYIWLPALPAFSRWVINVSYVVVQDETGLSPAAFDPVAFGTSSRIRDSPAGGGVGAWHVKTFGNLRQLEFGHYRCLQIVPHWRPGQRLSSFARSLNVSGDDIAHVGSALDLAYEGASVLPFRWGYSSAGDSCLRRVMVVSNQTGGGVLLSAWR